MKYTLDKECRLIHLISKNLQTIIRLMGFVSDRLENISGKGENAGYQHFLVISIFSFSYTGFKESSTLGLLR